VLADEAEVDTPDWTQGTFGLDLRAVLADVDNQHVAAGPERGALQPECRLRSIAIRSGAAKSPAHATFR
jgi:hypothetical protein